MTSQNSYPSQMFVRDYVKTTHDHAKYYNAFMPKNKNPVKIWIIGSIVCLLICIVIVSVIIWYSISDTTNETGILSQNGENADMFRSNFYGQQNFNYIKESEYKNNNFEKKVNQIQNFTASKNTTFRVTSPVIKNSTNENRNKNNASEILSDIEIEEESTIDKINIGDKLNLKNIVISALGTLGSVALGTKRPNAQHALIANVDKSNQSNTEHTNEIKTNLKNETIDTLLRSNQNQTEIVQSKDSNEDPKVTRTWKPANSAFEKKTYTLDSSVLNYLNGFISANERIQDMTMDNTQISSPDDSAGQATTNHINLLKEDADDTQTSSKYKPLSINSANNTLMMQIPNETDFTFQGLLTVLKSGIVKSDENYYDQDYMYSENDAQNFYYDYERVTWANYLLEKIQELYDWIITDMEIEGNSTTSKGNQYAPLPQILRALNYSLLEGDASILLLKIKDLYYANNSTDLDTQRNKKILANTSSVLSFGLLALDVLLLRNIQLIAWDNQETANREVLNDLEVFAFNALFMDPKEVKRIHEIIQKSKTGFLETDLESKGKDYYAFLNGEDLTSSFYKNINIGEELYNFITSTARAVMNLGYAFRRSRKQLGIDTKNIDITPQINIPKSNDNNRLQKIHQYSVEATEIDCMWTLYCKNLEKATKLDGVYGFLAKLNGIGLRLLLGDLSMELAIETLFKDTLTGPKKLNCEKLFPKCNNKNASKMILDDIISRTTLKD